MEYVPVLLRYRYRTVVVYGYRYEYIMCWTPNRNKNVQLQATATVPIVLVLVSAPVMHLISRRLLRTGGFDKLSEHRMQQLRRADLVVSCFAAGDIIIASHVRPEHARPFNHSERVSGLHLRPRRRSWKSRADVTSLPDVPLAGPLSLFLGWEFLRRYYAIVQG